MKRSGLAILLLVAGTSAAVGIPASSGSSGVRPGSNQIPLVVPPAESVAVQVVKLHVTGQGATRVAAPRRLELLNGASAPGATAMVAVNTTRTGTSTTITFVAVTVSRGTRSSAAPLPQISLTDAAGSAFSLAAVPGRKLDTIWRESSVFALNKGCNGCKVQASAVGLVDTGAIPPSRGVAFERAAEKLLDGPDPWDPFTKPQLLTADGVLLRLYDAKHPGGRPLQQAPAAKAVESSLQLLHAPAVSVRDDVYEQIDETSGCILGRVRCGSYVFSFKGLKETIVRSDDPSFKLTTRYSGTTCGRTLLGQPWKITTQSGKDPPVKHTVDLAKTNEVFTTYATVSGGGSGSAIHKLGPQPGAFPKMEALVDSTGVWSSDAGGQTVSVSATKLPAGKSC